MFVLPISPLHTQSPVCLLLENCKTVKRVKEQKKKKEKTMQLCKNVTNHPMDGQAILGFAGVFALCVFNEAIFSGEHNTKTLVPTTHSDHFLLC